jgi:hypothetical protein
MSPSETGRRNPNSVASFRTPRPAPGHTGAPVRRLFCSAKGRLISSLEPARMLLECQAQGQLAIVKAATVARTLSM